MALLTQGSPTADFPLSGGRPCLVAIYGIATETVKLKVKIDREDTVAVAYVLVDGATYTADTVVRYNPSSVDHVLRVEASSTGAGTNITVKVLE